MRNVLLDAVDGVRMGIVQLLEEFPSSGIVQVDGFVLAGAGQQIPGSNQREGGLICKFVDILCSMS